MKIFRAEIVDRLDYARLAFEHEGRVFNLFFNPGSIDCYQGTEWDGSVITDSKAGDQHWPSSQDWRATFAYYKDDPLLLLMEMAL